MLSFYFKRRTRAVLSATARATTLITKT